MKMEKLDNVLKHYGIIGMKWGVRRNPGPNGRVGSATKTTVKEKLGSLKRERSWRKVISQMDKLTTDEIVAVSKRVTLENDFKRLTKTSVATKKDKADYVRRADMDNETLSRTVTRLRAKDNLSKAVSSASKEQREFGKKVVDTTGTLAMTYAKNKTITPKDVFDSIKNPKPVKDALLKEALDKISK